MKQRSLFTVKTAHVLTERESAVLERLVAGLKPKAIARELFITEATVADHIKRILRKTGAPSAAEAAMRVLRARIVALEVQLELQRVALDQLTHVEARLSEFQEEPGERHQR